MEEQVTDFKMRVEEHVRSINELTIYKNKISSESSENAQRLEDAENKVSHDFIVPTTDYLTGHKKHQRIHVAHVC